MTDVTVRATPPAMLAPLVWCVSTGPQVREGGIRCERHEDSGANDRRESGACRPERRHRQAGRAPGGPLLCPFVLILAAGAVIAILLDDPSKDFAPKDGVSVFAGFFIAAQTIERLLEPIAPFFGRTKADSAPSPDNGGGADGGNGNPPASRATSSNPPLTGYVTKSQVLTVRDRALARCLRNPANSHAAAEAACAQELIEQIRRNTATIWTLGSAIGMVAAGGFGLLLVHAVDEPKSHAGWTF